MEKFRFDPPMYMRRSHNDIDGRDFKRYAEEFPSAMVAAKRGEQLPGVVGEFARAVLDLGFKDCPSGVGFTPNPHSIPTTLSALRGLSVGTFTAGGSFVAGEANGDAEEALRAEAVVGEAGAVPVTGLRGNVRFVYEDGLMTFSWKHELETVTTSTGVLGVINPRPKRLSGATTIQMQLEIQTNSNASQIVARSAISGVGEAMTEAALVGDGLAQPAGLYSTPDTGSVVFSGAATGTLVADFENQIVAAKGKDRNIVFIGHPEVRKKWKNVDRLSNGGVPLWSDDEKVMGKRALVSPLLANTAVCAGDFSKMFLCFWGDSNVPVQLIFDPFTNAASGGLTIVANVLADVVIVRPECFVVNSGSAVQ